MKTVFSGRELAHVWANKGVPHGRRSDNYMSFNGDAFSSYRTVIANRVKRGGKEAYVIDTAHFSSSTSKHQSHVRAAIRDADKVFNVRIGQFNQCLDFTPATLRDYYLTQYRKPASTSRYRHMRARDFLSRANYLSRAIDVCDYFNIQHVALSREWDKIQAELISSREIDTAWSERREQRCQARWEGRRQAQEARDAEYAKQDKENIAKWLAGEPVNPSYRWPTQLRAEHVNGEPGIQSEMVTTKGARVPLIDAKRTYQFVSKMRAKGWRANGETHAIGMYHLESVNEQGVVVGCHRVTWEEIDRFAGLMGWIEQPGI